MTREVERGAHGLNILMDYINLVEIFHGACDFQELAGSQYDEQHI